MAFIMLDSLSMTVNHLSLEQIAASAAVLDIPTPHRAYPARAIGFVLKQAGTRLQHRIDDIRIVAGELISNAVRHGNRRDASKRLRVYCSWREECFYFAVQDEGDGFDLCAPSYRCLPASDSVGLMLSERRADLLYNFNDPVAYACFDSRRTSERSA
jgi:hypothetical protein